jgi:exosortase/archaeosortase
MRAKTDINQKPQYISMGKMTARLLLGIIGWAAIISVWIWQAFRYSARDDMVGSILYAVVALLWTVFAVMSTRKHLSKGLSKTKPQNRKHGR